MKIAIPTNDKCSVAVLDNHTHWFKTFQIINESIVKEEYQRITKDLLQTQSEKSYELSILEIIDDCEIIITKSLTKEFEKNIKKNKKQVFISNEVYITNAIIQYLDFIRLTESNLCCQP